MMSGKKILILLYFLILFPGFVLFSQGYKITVDAPQFAGSEAIIAEYFTSRMVPKDTIVLNKKGTGIFKGKSPFDGGLYVLYFNARQYLDFMLDKDQVFTIYTDSTDFTNRTKFDGSLNNEIFYDYKKFLADNRKIQEGLVAQYSSAETTSDSSLIRDKLEKLNKKISGEINQLIEEHENLFFSTFLLSMNDNYAPDEIVTGTDRQKDSIRYNYFRIHYFDHFDVSDIRLLHTPLYEQKIKTYINKVAIQHPDSLIVEVDKLIEKTRENEALFRYMVITLFNNFAESKMMGMDKVYFHIAEKYYIPEATWSSDDFIEKLKENLEKSKYTFINNPAPDIILRGLPEEHFQMAEMDTVIKNDPHAGYSFRLYDVSAEYTLLYFWEADCSHCKKTTPQLYNVFEKYKDQDVKVVAVHVINSVEGKVTWIDFVNQYGLYDWINCWSPYSNRFRDLYNLQSFPQLFLLDKDKKILAKTITPEQADDLLNRFLNDKK